MFELSEVVLSRSRRGSSAPPVCTCFSLSELSTKHVEESGLDAQLGPQHCVFAASVFTFSCSHCKGLSGWDGKRIEQPFHQHPSLCIHLQRASKYGPDRDGTIKETGRFSNREARDR